MPKQKEQERKGEESFGDRLARLRKAAGYSLRALALEIGTSHNMLIYYERNSGSPAAHIAGRLAHALGVSTDQLLGIEKMRTSSRVRDTKLWRRFNEVEKLPPTERKPIVQFIDAILEKERFRRAR